MPSEFGFEPRSPRYSPFLVLGLFHTNNANSAAFLAIFGPFLAHIMELEGIKGLFVTRIKGLFVTRKSRHTWSVATVSLHLTILNGF